MYSTCLFCNQSLGANEVVEAFPVGRRLAFDQKRGRLWVVCRRCEKWNLTPLEERWEAMETCERLFRDTPRRVSTDNIGLAKLSEGLELLRIGVPGDERYSWALRLRVGLRDWELLLKGDQARRVAAKVVPHINKFGGSQKERRETSRDY